MSNPWILNLGKLVVPNVFVEPMLIRELAIAYDSSRWSVRTPEGYVLLDISHRAIIECFGLDGSALKGINIGNMKREYPYKRDRYRKDLAPHL